MVEKIPEAMCLVDLDRESMKELDGLNGLFEHLVGEEKDKDISEVPYVDTDMLYSVAKYAWENGGGRREICLMNGVPNVSFDIDDETYRLFLTPKKDLPNMDLNGDVKEILDNAVEEGVRSFFQQDLNFFPVLEGYSRRRVAKMDDRSYVNQENGFHRLKRLFLYRDGRFEDMGYTSEKERMESARKILDEPLPENIESDYLERTDEVAYIERSQRSRRMADFMVFMGCSDTFYGFVDKEHFAPVADYLEKYEKGDIETPDVIENRLPYR